MSEPGTGMIGQKPRRGRPLCPPRPYIVERGPETFAASIRYPFDQRKQIGTFRTRALALAACLTYIATGALPKELGSKRGRKPGGKNRPKGLPAPIAPKPEAAPLSTARGSMTWQQIAARYQ